MPYMVSHAHVLAHAYTCLPGNCLDPNIGVPEPVLCKINIFLSILAPWMLGNDSDELSLMIPTTLQLLVNLLAHMTTPAGGRCGSSAAITSHQPQGKVRHADS